MLAPRLRSRHRGGQSPAPSPVQHDPVHVLFLLYRKSSPSLSYPPKMRETLPSTRCETGFETREPSDRVSPFFHSMQRELSTIRRRLFRLLSPLISTNFFSCAATGELSKTSRPSGDKPPIIRLSPVAHPSSRVCCPPKSTQSESNKQPSSASFQSAPILLHRRLSLLEALNNSIQDEDCSPFESSSKASVGLFCSSVTLLTGCGSLCPRIVPTSWLVLVCTYN